MQFRNAILNRIKPSDMALLSSSMTEASFGQGDVLYDVGDEISDLLFPGTAIISVITVMKDGQCVETATIGFESAPGLLTVLANGRAMNRVVAQVPGSAIRISAKLIREVGEESPELLSLLLVFAEADSSQTSLSVACNALHGVPARLARWLLLTHDRVGSSSIPLTQEALSIMLGVQRTTVSAASSTLRKLGLISYARGHIKIVDRQKLQTASCECYDAGRQIANAMMSPT